MRISDDSGDTVGHNRARKLRRRAEAAFNVNVGINQTGDDKSSLQINHGLCLIAWTYTDNLTTGKGNCGAFNCSRKDVDDLTIL